MKASFLPFVCGQSVSAVFYVDPRWEYIYSRAYDSFICCIAQGRRVGAVVG